MKDSRLYLLHMRDSVRKILTYTEGLGREWSGQPMVLGAVCRNLEINGEAANQLGASYRALHPAVPWRKIIGARNILIHAYDLVQPDILEEVVERDLPILRVQVEQLLKEASPPAD